jgi:hypothetical protein
MGWANPVPNGVYTRGFAPSAWAVDGPMFADAPLRRAHDPGNGAFLGSSYHPHFHAALDVAAGNGTPILAPEAGIVMDARWGSPGTWANGGGWYFRVAVNEGCMYLGAHCSKLRVSEGQHVTKGQHIADVGMTGTATGNHLHFWARLGPRPYYDPDAYYWNPALVLPGGPLFNDSRFAPGYDELPDTGIDDLLRADGDPAPMRFRSEVKPNGMTIQRTLLANKPIRKDATVNSDVWRRFTSRKSLNFVGRIPKDDLPAAERPFGDVLITPLYVNNGHVFGYVKQIDLAGN